MPKSACFGRDVFDHSDKDCCCGCHSRRDHKKSRSHHGTRSRMLVRKARDMMKSLREKSCKANDESWALRMAELEESSGGFPGVTGSLAHKHIKSKLSP